MHKIWILWLILIYRNPFWKNIFSKCIKGALPTSVYQKPVLTGWKNILVIIGIQWKNGAGKVVAIVFQNVLPVTQTWNAAQVAVPVKKMRVIVTFTVIVKAGIYILKKIRNYTKTKIQNGETLPKLNIGIYSKFDQY